jgi:hypothetical protein
MTMITIGKFNDRAVIVSESRASYDFPQKLVPNQSLFVLPL